MKLSVRKLRARHACEEQVDLFRKTFGSGTITVTPELCMKHAQLFDFYWARSFLLPDEKSAIFRRRGKKMRNLFEEEMEPAYLAYEGYRDTFLRKWERFRKKYSQMRRSEQKKAMSRLDSLYRAYCDSHEEANKRFEELAKKPQRAYKRKLARLFGSLL